MDTSDLAKRMKEYESVSKTKLISRLPVILRLDGKSFHTFTKGFQKPFDEILIKTMQDTMKYLCENIQGCVLGYTQSDEITLVLVNYERLNSEPWLGYKVQKMCSIAASMCTMIFNKYFDLYARDYCTYEDCKYKYMDNIPNDVNEYMCALEKSHKKGAMFDCRAFNLPKEEVTNCIYWRQLDATRNSIQMVGQAIFSHKELQNKTCNQIQDMLLTQKGINWNDLDTYLKRGSCCLKRKYFEQCEKGKEIKYSEGCSDLYEDDEIEKEVWRSKWVIDKDIPIFKEDGRVYIDKLIFVGE